MDNFDKQFLYPQCLRSTFGQLRMRTQICMINWVIFLIVLSFLFIILAINRQYAMQILSESAGNTMMVEISNHLFGTLASFDRQVSSAFLKTQIMLTTLNQLYWHYLTVQDQVQFLTKLCDLNSTTFPEDHFYQIPCISYTELNNPFALPQSRDEYQLRNFTNKFGSVVYEVIDLTLQFLPNNVYLISAESESGYAFVYPQMPKFPSFHPRERIWYLNHMNNLKNDSNNNTQLSDIYRYFGEDTYSMTITQSMLNLQKEVKGIFASDIKLRNKDFQNEFMNILIVNHDGRLILTNYKSTAVSNSSTFDQFDDEKITGFNHEDWIAVVQYADDGKINSTCSFQSNQFCRYNSVYKQDVVIVARKINNLNYLLISFYDYEVELKIFQDIDNMIIAVTQVFYLLLATMIFVALFLMILQVILINCIFHPFYLLIQRSTCFLKRERMLEPFKMSSRHFKKYQSRSKEVIASIKQYLRVSTKLLKENDSDNALIQLNNTFHTLFDRVLTTQQKVNPQCYILQQFKYPKKTSDVQSLSQLIKTLEIKNYEYKFKELSPKKFQHHKTLYLNRKERPEFEI